MTPAPAEPVALGEVVPALGLGRHELVALVGGGGKTTLLFALGRQLTGRVLLTSTTKMETGCAGRVQTVLNPTDDDVWLAFATSPVVLALSGPVDRKLHGVTPDTVDRWFDHVDHVVVEADGSRGRPATAPAPHEPALPSKTTRVLAVIGADALGRVIADQCHRPLRIAAVAGCSPYERLTPERAVTLLNSDRGMRKSLPPRCRFTAVVTKVDPASRDLVDRLAGLLADRAIDHVLVSRYTAEPS